MPDLAHQLLEQAALWLELTGVAVILVSVLVATVIFIRALTRHEGLGGPYERYRANLGRGILLGLEFLVAGDIIATVTAPLTFSSVGLLGLIVLIRTFLSFALETEITGRWPWKRAEGDRSEHREIHS